MKAARTKTRPPRVLDLAARARRGTLPEQLALERAGLPARVIPELAAAMALPQTRLMEIMATPRASLARKVAADAALSGDANRRTLNLLRLLALAREIVADSTAPAAQELDVPRWLGRWIESPQPALGGARPAELLDTDAGARAVEQALGSLRSGAWL